VAASRLGAAKLKRAEAEKEEQPRAALRAAGADSTRSSAGQREELDDQPPNDAIPISPLGRGFRAREISLSSSTPGEGKA
jgi:hypothetical protein